MKVSRLSKFFVFFSLLLVIICSFPGVTLAGEEILIMSVGKGNSSISASGRTVTFSGTSSSSTVQDTLSIYIYLQEKRGSSWVTIDSSSKSVNNAIMIAHSKSTTVSGGSYYRTRSYHRSVTNGVTHGFYTYSDERWVP